MKATRDAGDPKRRVIWLLAAVLAVGFGLRLWMILVVPRYFDDHYVFNNIAPYLDGSLQPRHSYYGTLSYLPQAFALGICELLHSLTGFEALTVHGTQFEGFTLGAFRIMRMFGLAYALLSIWMIYLVGRRLVSPTAGLIAAAVLAAYPQHLRSATQLKPDMLALLLTLVTLYWTVGAARNPRLSRFLLVGVGVGLAVSAKYIGLASALPLTAWAVWSGFRDRRHWLRLCLAGMASVATFFILNPFFGKVFHFGFRLVWYYGRMARREESSRLMVLRRELDFFASQHGWLLGAFLLLGMVFLVWQLWHKEGNGEALLPLSLCFGFPLLHTLGVSFFRTHNLLPALAGTALICAFGIVHTGRWLGERRMFLRSPTAVLIASSLLGGVLLLRSCHYVYEQLVPGNWDVASKALRSRLVRAQTIYAAYEPASAPLTSGRHYIAKTAVPALSALPPSRLDLVDAELFPLSRTEGPHATFYRNRQQRLTGECVEEVHPRLFRSRGDPLVLLFHPWKPAEKTRKLTVRRSSGRSSGLAARLPSDLAAGEVLSLELIRPAKGAKATMSLRTGNQLLPLGSDFQNRQKTRLWSPRFRYDTGMTEIHIHVTERAYPKNFQLRLRRWRRAPCQ
jgi:hypothetical protein